MRRMGMLWLVGALAVSACADEDTGGAGITDPEAQPAPEGTAFVEGDFGDIPLFRGATPLQEPVRAEDGTVTGSYETLTGGPQSVLEFYRDSLPALGWVEADPIVETSPGVWRGDWLGDGRRLQVSAQSLSDEDTFTQFNLVLLPDRGDVPVETSPVTTGS